MPRGGEGIPVNKELVAWARKRAGLSLSEAEQKFRHIAAWEADRRCRPIRNSKAWRMSSSYR